nr:lasso peptide biosynthesis B2 protein [Sphingomonas japonica]
MSWVDERPPRRDNARITWVVRAQTAAAATGTAAKPATLFQLWREERRAARRLRTGIGAGLDLLASVARGEERPRAQQALVTASWRARRLWSAEDRCLPRSIALARVLRAEGSGAKLVLGVTGQPFATHAWVQDGDVVLNDTRDHVRLFMPLLIA